MKHLDAFVVLVVAVLLFAFSHAFRVPDPPDASELALRRPPAWEVVPLPPPVVFHWSEFFHVPPALSLRDRFRGEYEDDCNYLSGFKRDDCNRRKNLQL
jgi:hypothetical protein